MDSIVEMFSVSEKKFGIKYMYYIKDGDSITFINIIKLNPYGDNFAVVKSKCIGHVKKNGHTAPKQKKRKTWWKRTLD